MTSSAGDVGNVMVSSGLPPLDDRMPLDGDNPALAGRPGRPVHLIGVMVAGAPTDTLGAQ
jgi:hypothetical protein